MARTQQPSIIAGVDFTPLSFHAARIAADLAISLGSSRLHLIHVSAHLSFESDVLPFVGAVSAETQRLEQLALDEARSKLERLELPATDLPVAREVRSGSTSQQLLEAAREYSAEAIVVGTRGHGPIGTLFLGSVTANLLRLGHCPVLVVGPENPRLENLGRVVAAIDLSDASAVVLQEALSIAVRTRAELDVLYVVEPFAMPAAKGPRAFPDEDLARALVIDRVARLDAPGEVTIRTHVVRGEASEVIQEAATESGELLVMGTSGRSGFARALLGSTANRVISATRVPVLVIPYARTAVER